MNIELSDFEISFLIELLFRVEGRDLFFAAKDANAQNGIGLDLLEKLLCLKHQYDDDDD